MHSRKTQSVFPKRELKKYLQTDRQTGWQIEWDEQMRKFGDRRIESVEGN